MKRYLAATLTACCTLGLVSTAVADGRGWDDRGHRHERSWRDHDRHHDRGRRDRDDDRRERRSYERGYDRGYDHGRNDHRGRPVVVVPSHRGGPRWHRGEYLPPRYRAPSYVVHDWRARRFDAPPRGHQWMHVNGEYLLVGIATGMILQSIIGR